MMEEIPPSLRGLPVCRPVGGYIGDVGNTGGEIMHSHGKDTSPHVSAFFRGTGNVSGRTFIVPTPFRSMQNLGATPSDINFRVHGSFSAVQRRGHSLHIVRWIMCGCQKRVTGLLYCSNTRNLPGFPGRFLVFEVYWRGILCEELYSKRRAIS